MSITVITKASADNQPITKNLLKLHLSMLPPETDWDSLIDMYLGSAKREWTATTKRALLVETVRQTFDCFPCERYFRIERAPLISLTSIQYFNDSGAWVTLPTTVYSWDALEEAPIVQLKNEQSWPSDIHRTALNCVRLTYTCGYGVDDTSIDDDIKRCLSMFVGDSFLNRENSVAAPGMSVASMPGGSNPMMAKYKLNFYEHKSQSRRQ